MSTSFYPVKPGGAEDKADVGITLLIYTVTQIGRPTRDAVSYCIWLRRGWAGKTAQTVRNRISSVLSNLGNQAEERE